MTDEPLVDLVFVLGARGSCPTTIGGWIWYCDEHDTHGNADSEEEAEFMADAHVEYFRMAEGLDDDDDSFCAMYVVIAGEGRMEE